MTDLEERLRDWPRMTPAACKEAADEIERLTAALAELAEENDPIGAFARKALRGKSGGNGQGRGENLMTSPISLTDPAVILAGIRQFGLASDGSDLRDLEAAIERLRAVIVRAKDALLDGQSTQWVHDLLVKGLLEDNT
jgi:hypothetical protein